MSETSHPSRDPKNLSEPFAVIEFLEKNEKGLPCIDLVPKKWFNSAEEDTCKFPPTTEYHLLDDYLEKLHSPKDSWQSYPFCFITGAADLDQGRRRLKKAQVTLNCETTDGENDRKGGRSETSSKAKISAKPLTASKSQLNNIFSTKIPIPPRNQTPKSGIQAKPKTRFQSIYQSGSDSEDENHDCLIANPEEIRASKAQNNSGFLQMSSKSRSVPTGACLSFKQRSRKNITLLKDVETDESESNDSSDGILQSPTKSMDSARNTRKELHLTPPSPLVHNASGNRKRRASSTTRAEDGLNSIVSPGTPKTSRSMMVPPAKMPKMLGPQNQLSSSHYADNERRILNSLRDYFDQQLDEKLENLRRRMAYDLKQSMNELKTTIIGTNLAPASGPSLLEIQKQMSTPLLFEMDDKFQEYEAILTTDPNLVETLRLFMRVLISNKKEMKICVSTILSAVLRKTVSLHYSGYGKEAGGKKKKNVYNTTVCKVLIDVIIEVIGSSTDEKKIMSEVSTWLSRSGDREGGRKERQRGSSHHNENNSVCSFDTNR
ncbi:uncharacterized protein LOC135161085 [Diachasmimorpha longicaudata]|uniref:uncharacterized protein LOC135161085 n=1 Tax=Diachasmimorpha longicaudata TaxID=58733 RepID=UPI0030B8B9D0